MKKLFPGYYKYSVDEYKEIWKNGIIVLDTNALLDFYRLSESSSSDFLHVIEEYKERLYMPYQVADEYHRNLESVICEQIKKYEDTSKNLEGFVSLLNNDRSHPFVPKNLEDKAKKLLGDIQKVFDEQENKLIRSLMDNSIKDKIAQIYDGKVGKKMENSQIEDICKEGEERYENKIPPGYMDKGKDNNKYDKNDYRRYGDLIIWKDIISYAKSNKCHILFVTNDDKEDWIWKVRGKTIGPRPELIKEFMNATGQFICIYNLSNFIKQAMKQDKKKVNEKALTELRTLTLERESVEENDFSKEKNSGQQENIETASIAEIKNIVHKNDTTMTIGSDAENNVKTKGYPPAKAVPAKRGDKNNKLVTGILETKKEVK